MARGTLNPMRRSRGRWQLSHRVGQRVLFLALLAILGALVLPPMWVLISTSIHSWTGFQQGPLSLENYQSLLDTPATWSLIRNSVVYAVGSSGLALVIGTGLAWLVERTNSPLKSLVYVGVFVSFAVPGIIQTIGWVLLLGPEAGMVNSWAQAVFGLSGPIFNIFSMQGMILVEGFSWAPVVFLLMVPAFQSMDSSLEEAATVSGAGIWQTFRRVTFTLARPSVLAALLLSVIRALESFEVPAVLGIPAGVRVLTTEIYRNMRSGGIAPTYGVASSYAVLMFLMVLALLYAYNRQTRASKQFATITGKGYRPHRIDLGAARWLAAAACLILPISVVLPVLLLAWASFLPYYIAPSTSVLELMSLDNYRSVFEHPIIGRSVLNTLEVAIITATLATVLGLLIAWLVVRTEIKARGILDQIATFPFVIPGIVAGVAISRTYVGSDLPIYGTIFIIVIAYVMLGMPYAMRFAHAGMLRVHAELEESAVVSGAKLSTVLIKIVIPLMLPALTAGWIYIFLYAIRHLSSAIILSGPGTEVIAVTILELWENGQVTELGALSVLIVIGAVLLSGLFFQISRRYGIRN